MRMLVYIFSAVLFSCWIESIEECPAYMDYPFPDVGPENPSIHQPTPHLGKDQFGGTSTHTMNLCIPWAIIYFKQISGFNHCSLFLLLLLPIQFLTFLYLLGIKTRLFMGFSERESYIILLSVQWTRTYFF